MIQNKMIAIRRVVRVIIFCRPFSLLAQRVNILTSVTLIPLPHVTLSSEIDIFKYLAKVIPKLCMGFLKWNHYNVESCEVREIS